jgi:hypothetical protein
MEKTLLHKIWRGYKMAYIKEGHIFCDARWEEGIWAMASLKM